MSFITTLLIVAGVVSYVTAGAYLFVSGAHKDSKLKLVAALIMLIFGIAFEIYGLEHWWLP